MALVTVFTMELLYSGYRLGICIPIWWSLKTSQQGTRQKDPLIARGGTVTMGLQVEESDNGRGVYWSLSLAHARYYGDQVVSERSVNCDPSRVSIDDLWLIALGSLFALWGIEALDIKAAAELIFMMWQKYTNGLAAVETFAKTKPGPANSWPRYLGDAAQRFVGSSGLEQSSCRRLLGLGERKATIFGHLDNAIPVFGLTDVPLMHILRLESRIQYLRDIAQKICNETDVLVIKICTYGANGKEMSSFQIATVSFGKAMPRRVPRR